MPTSRCCLFSEIQLSRPDCLILLRPAWTTLTRWSTSPNCTRPPSITMTTLMQIKAITTLSTVQSNLKTDLNQPYLPLYQPHLPVTEQQLHPKWPTVGVMRYCQVRLISVKLHLLCLVFVKDVVWKACWKEETSWSCDHSGQTKPTFVCSAFYYFLFTCSLGCVTLYSYYLMVTLH